MKRVYASFTTLFALGLPLIAQASEGAHAAAEAEGGGHGIPWGPIGLHAFNLALLVGVLLYFVRPKVVDAIKNRSASIKREVDEANQARKEAEEKYKELEGRLAGMEQQLAGMRQQAEAEARREREAILSRGADDARQIGLTAARSIRDESLRARQSLREEAAKIAIELAAVQVAQQIQADDQDRLTEDFLAAVSASASTSNADRPSGKDVRNG
jgi:F-type H+-transporting ATPase subunit b